MKMFRKLLCAALAVALIAVTAAGALAAAVDQTLYRTNSEGTLYDYVYLQQVDAGSNITGVSSSNTKVMKPVSLNRGTNSQSVYTYEDGKTQKTKSYSAYLYVKLLKKGKATLKYTVDKTKYTRTYQVKNYVNPLSSLVLTGVGTTNLKSKFAKYNFVSATLKKNAKAGKVKAKAASGWKIRSVEWQDCKNNTRYLYSNGGAGASSVSLNVPKMLKSGYYNVTVRCVNTADKGELYVEYEIGSWY